MAVILKSGDCDPQFVYRSPDPFKGWEGARAMTQFPGLHH